MRNNEARADAPGRVNLIGEHTDYHDGFVLPTLIPQRTRVRLRPRPDRRVWARSTSAGAAEASYVLGEEARQDSWVDYVQGATAALARTGVSLAGFDISVNSAIPVGAGLSSSAALTVAVLRGIRELFRLSLDDLRLALLAHAAEFDFVGAPVGKMDQMASSLGHSGEALFIDTRSLQTTRVPLPGSIEFVVIDSGVAHKHAGGGYVTRRQESFEAAAALGVGTLRELGPGDLPRVEALPPTLARRARHVITENARVLDAVTALHSGDVDRLGRLFAESHRSLRDDYEVSTPDVDRLVDLAQQHDAIYGARMTGGGFGGAVVAAAMPGSAEAAREIAAEYSAETGRFGAVLATIAPDPVAPRAAVDVP